MNLLFYSIYFLWFLSEVLLNRLIRSGKSDKKAKDKNTEIYLWMAVIFTITISVYISAAYPTLVVYDDRIKLIGLIIIVLGVIFRFIAIKQLGRFFTVNVTIRNDHQLIQSGLYKYLRHPSYSGSLLSFLGFGVSLNNWLSIIFIIIPYFIAVMYRISIEEKALTEQFGKQYIDYKKQTKRLIPFLY
ncbi:MAG: isoprenylcysteine carboxylmethyltransferase family protein [Bacteroidota bacterium]